MSIDRGVTLPPSSRFGTLLKRYRVSAGLTQEQLAELAGLSVRGISDLERGVASRPQRETLAALLEALQLSSRERARMEALAGQRPAVSSDSGIVTGEHGRFTSLVGRAHELTLIEHHLMGGAPPVLVLAGEPGIGKTRLLQEGARLATGAGYTVLQGGGQRWSGQDGYAPMLDILSRSLTALSRARRRSVLAGCGWLARLLPELTEIAALPMPAGVIDPEQERRLVFAATGRYLSNLAGSAGTLLVLDDLQWSGSDGLSLLMSLLASDPDHTIRVLCAYRDTEVDAKHPLSGMLASLAERDLAHHVALSPLCASEAQEILDDLLSDREGIDAGVRQAVVARTGGVPFFLVSCAHWLTLGTADNQPQGLPWNVTQSVRQRVAALSPSARAVLAAAAVAGRVAPRAILPSVAGLPPTQVEAGLDVARRARLLISRGRSAVEFVHDVVRESIEADLGESQRISLHVRIAEALEQLPERDRPGRAAELAWHFLEGDEPSRAMLYTLEAGDEARTHFAHEEAERQYEMAIQLAREIHVEDREAEALERLGTLYWTLGRYSEALKQLDAAARLYERLWDLSSLGRVAGKIGWTHCHQGTGAEGIQYLQALARRLEELGPSAALVDIYDSLVPLYWRHGDSELILVAAQRAAGIASALSSVSARVRGELNRGLVLWDHGHLEDARRVLEHVIPRAEELRDADSLFRALAWTANVYADMGQLERARPYLERATQVTELATSPSFHTSALDWLAELLFALGNWREAREYWQRAIAVEQEHLGWAGGDAHLGLARLALAEGKREEVTTHLEKASSVFQRTGWPAQDRRPGFQCVLAQRDLLERRPSDALARLEPVAGGFDLRAGTSVHERQALTEAALEFGNLARAAPLVEEGARGARASGHLPVLIGWLRLQGMFLTRAGRWKEARDALKEGLALARAMPCPYEAGRILFEIGRMHVSRREESPARASFGEGLAIFRELGAKPYIKRTEDSLKGLAESDVRL